MNQTSVNLLALACIILLPIVPAYFLFKALPSSAAVTGPLQGLSIKLGGAFAGYFAVLLVAVFSIVPSLTLTSPYQLWSVSGTLTDGSGRLFHQVSESNFQVTPPHFVIDDSGHFQFKFTTEPAPLGNAPVFPKLTVRLLQFEALDVPLNPKQLEARTDLGMHPGDINRDERTIDLHLTLHSAAALGDYAPVGSLPSPGSATTPGGK
jgi:hypothetical protein